MIVLPACVLCALCVCLVPKEAERWHTDMPSLYIYIYLYTDSCEPVLGTKLGSSARATSANCQSSLQPLSFLFQTGFHVLRLALGSLCS